MRQYQFGMKCRQGWNGPNASVCSLADEETQFGRDMWRQSHFVAAVTISSPIGEVLSGPERTLLPICTKFQFRIARPVSPS
jgi:hypothetical protein